MSYSSPGMNKKRMLTKPHAISRTNGFRKRQREIFQKGEKGANETRIWETGIKRGAGVPEMPKARCRAFSGSVRAWLANKRGTHPPKTKAKSTGDKVLFFVERSFYAGTCSFTAAASR